MIAIQLNGKEQLLQQPLTLKELLEEIRIQNRAIAVAVNSEVIPRSEFEKVLVRDKDQIEVIHAVGGG